jgi:hypothetical protein
VSVSLAEKIQFGLDELAVITWMIKLPLIETAATCTMLHSLYTEVEEILNLVALDFDKKISSSESWHRDLLRTGPTVYRRKRRTGLDCAAGVN